MSGSAKTGTNRREAYLRTVGFLHVRIARSSVARVRRVLFPLDKDLHGCRQRHKESPLFVVEQPFVNKVTNVASLVINERDGVTQETNRRWSVTTRSCLPGLCLSFMASSRLQLLTKNAVREIDIDSGLAETLKQYIGGKQAGRVFEARNGSPISGNNILKRVLHPLLKRLGIPRAGLHAFRHSRVTMLRKNGTPEDLQKQWIGHSSLRTTDRYSHTNQELEYRRLAASKAGLSFTVGPNGPNSALGKSAATI